MGIVVRFYMDLLKQAVAGANDNAYITAVGVIVAALLTAIAAVANSAAARSKATASQLSSNDTRTAQEQDAKYFREELSKERTASEKLQDKLDQLTVTCNGMHKRLEAIEAQLTYMDQALDQETPETAARIRKNATRKRIDASNANQ